MVKVFVGNLPPSASNQSLKEIFQKYKDLQDYKLISNYGFVYLETEESAIHAVNNLNGLEYRGFPLAVDFAREDTKLKRKADAIMESRPKAFVPLPKRFSQPNTQQRNMNPYNLPFLNSVQTQAPVPVPIPTRKFDNVNERRYGPVPQYNKGFSNNVFNTNGFDTNGSNNNGYNSGFNSAGYNNDVFNNIGFNNESFNRDGFNNCGFNSSGFDDSFENYRDEYDSGNASIYPMNDFLEHPMVSGFSQDFYSRHPPTKKFRTEYFTEDDAYDFNFNMRYQPEMQNPDMFRSSRMGLLKRPNWYEANRGKPLNHHFLSQRDRKNYAPRRGGKHQDMKSYIDEYEDNNDYSSIDPYPAYLKQYQK